MEETQISTPANDGAEETSQNVGHDNTQTPTGEPDANDNAAETETNGNEGNNDGKSQEPETLYAGKYKTVEDLVNGYKEAEKFVAKSSELEKQIQALNESKRQAEEKAKQERLEQARLKGFMTPEEQEISEQVQVSELELYANNLHLVNPNAYETARQYLQQYAQTGQKAYLDEAKNYFPSNVIEQIALQKSQYETQLKNAFNRKMQEQANANEAKLANDIKDSYPEFLADLDTNTGKANALKAFCDCGLIQSKEHMGEFINVYNAMAKYEREQAIKEFKAQQAIEETKNKASINSDSQTGVGSSDMPTAKAMQENPKLYREAVKKYGMDKVDAIIMKG